MYSRRKPTPNTAPTAMWVELTGRPRCVATMTVTSAGRFKKVALITGGAGAVGAATARMLAQDGFAVVLVDREIEAARAVGAEIERDYGVRGVGVLFNVTGGLAKTVDGDGGPAEILYVGRLRIRKGVEVLLEALAALRREHPSARLMIAGAGEQAAALHAKTAELGLDDRVRFLGRCDAAHVRRLLTAARCLVVPSIYEGMPLVVLEAMAAGTPVVASAVSGIPEVVIDGETGWLVPSEDPPRLAAALAEVLADPAGARRRGAAGRRRLEEEFTPEKAARQWLDLVAGRGRLPDPEPPGLV